MLSLGALRDVSLRVYMLVQALFFVKDGRTICVAISLVSDTACRQNLLLPASLLRVQIQSRPISLSPRIVSLNNIAQVSLQRGRSGIHKRL